MSRYLFMGAESDLLARFQEIIAEVEGSARPLIRFLHRAEGGGALERKKLGVFPSSFNPITVAHNKIVSQTRDAFQLDEVLLLLDLRNVDKGVFGASLEDRLAMICEFCKASTHLSAAMASHGLFVDKVPALLEVYSQDVEIHFIVGQDTIERVLDASYYRERDRSLSELFQRARFIVVPREERGEEGVKGLINRPVNRPYRKRIEIMALESAFCAISSTLVRGLVAKRMPFEHMVPEAVFRYIKKRDLYRSS